MGKGVLGRRKNTETKVNIAGEGIVMGPGEF